MSQFQVRLFAHLRDRHGPDVTVEAPPHVEGVLRALQASGIETKGCRLSIDLAFPQGDAPIREGAELALIPPVSGG